MNYSVLACSILFALIVLSRPLNSWTDILLLKYHEVEVSNVTEAPLNG